MRPKRKKPFSCSVLRPRRVYSCDNAELGLTPLARRAGTGRRFPRLTAAQWRHEQTGVTIAVNYAVLVIAWLFQAIVSAKTILSSPSSARGRIVTDHIRSSILLFFALATLGLLNNPP